MSDTDLRPSSDPGADERDGYTMNSYREFAAKGWGGDTDARGATRFLGPLALLGVLGLLWYFGGITMVVIVGALILSIVLHELGHFLTAKWAGMKATEFFVGFGPRIWSITRGETEYGIKMIPAGAYVRIIGMHNLEEVDDGDEERTYRSKSYPKRLAVILAGPFMNIFLAFFIFVFVFAALGIPDMTQWHVTQVTPGSAAEAAHLQPGDRVVQIGDQSLSEFQDLKPIVDAKAGQTVDITVLRANGTTETVPNVPLGWRIGSGAAAAIPGMEKSDAIVDPNDESRVIGMGYPEFAEKLATGSGPYTFKFQRGYYIYENTVQLPITVPADGASGFVGISTKGDEPPRLHESVPGAVVKSGQQMGGIVGASGQALGRLFSPSGLANYANTVAENAPGAEQKPAQVKELHKVVGAPENTPKAINSSDADRPMSIIGAVRATNDVAKVDAAAALLMLAVINLSLGLLNLLPFLPLDGGHAAVATYEAIRSRPGRPYRVDMMKLMPVTYAFIAVLMVFGLSAMFLDIRAPVSP